MDFRCPRRFLSGIQDYYNRKGLLSDRGQKKQAFYVLRITIWRKREVISRVFLYYYPVNPLPPQRRFCVGRPSSFVVCPQLAVSWSRSSRLPFPLAPRLSRLHEWISLRLTAFAGPDRNSITTQRFLTAFGFFGDHRKQNPRRPFRLPVACSSSESSPVKSRTSRRMRFDSVSSWLAACGHRPAAQARR